VAAVFAAMYLPTLVDPVKAILSTPGCFTKYDPTSPYPLRTYTTPGGKPASLAKAAILKADKGVFSEVFNIETEPAAKQGPHFHANIKIGKFQGIIWAQTPTGSNLV